MAEQRHELTGLDLRVHVFDGDKRWASAGREDLRQAGELERKAS
jgi:hypothetical protein